jgi:hypothetical protein
MPNGQSRIKRFFGSALRNDPPDLTLVGFVGPAPSGDLRDGSKAAFAQAAVGLKTADRNTG